MKVREGSLKQLKQAAQEYDDIFGIFKNEKKPGSLIILCFPNYNLDKIQEFVTENLPVTISYEIREMNKETQARIDELLEAFQKGLDEFIHQETLKLMHTYSLTYGEAYGIVLSNLNKS